MSDKDDENLGSFYMGRARTSSQPKRHFPPGVLTTAALLVFAGILWYAYPRGAEKYHDMDVPVVKADTAPIKTQPVDPGGMEVRHQDSTVFDPLEKTAAGEVEKLLPAQEAPINKNVDIKPAPPAEEVKKAEIVPPAKAEKKKAPVAAAGDAYVQLGSFRNVDGAKKDWQRLKTKYPRLFARLEMRTARVELPAKGIYYRLQAGKVDNARAKEICAALREEKVSGCIVVRR